MKKLNILSLFVLVTFVSCSKQIEEPVPQEKNMNPISTSIIEGNKLTPDNIVDYANRLRSAISPGTRSVEVESIEAITTSNIYFNGVASRTTSNDDTLVYALNYAGNSGFMLLSSDARVQPLAISDDGAFHLDNNPGVKMFLQAAKLYVDQSVECYNKAMDSVNMLIPQSRIVGNTDVFVRYDYVQTGTSLIRSKAPLLRVAWGQGAPYNDYFETCYIDGNRFVAGCVTTALAQILSLHQWPSTAVDPVTNKTITYSWYDMKSDPNANNIRTNKHHVGIFVKSIADLIGAQKLHLDNNSHATAGGFGDVAKIQSWGYKKTNINNVEVSWTDTKQQEYNYSVILSSIDINRPVYIRGTETSDKNTGGHAWVLDGYKELGEVRWEVYKVFRRANGTEYRDSRPYTSTTLQEAAKLVHCNWGWGQKCNGYYNQGVWNRYVELDNPNLGTQTTNFIYNILIHANICRKY